ncbi:GtrA family protein [Aeoliella sp. ICT_H6.2]|uniref:GtrA family protein n=1 Tax=Aeoliella straminimaris TaxID=2954799 RepID=A0A9X2JHE0_9BACT|nr:GtrA family protein [Aeoliella straminimaris]MCO6045955.1 GtrA family protein [Aeoliella straminimaris]
MRLQSSAKRLLQQPSDSVAVQAFRFTLVGLVAFAIDYSLLMVAVLSWQWNYLASAAIAYTTGLTVNYLLCVRWVFAQRRFQNAQREFALFFVIGIAGLALTELILWVGKELLGQDIALAKLAALVAVAIWNFSLRKIVLFSKGSPFAATQSDLATSPS